MIVCNLKLNLWHIENGAEHKVRHADHNDSEKQNTNIEENKMSSTVKPDWKHNFVETISTTISSSKNKNRSNTKASIENGGAFNSSRIKNKSQDSQPEEIKRHPSMPGSLRSTEIVRNMYVL